MSEYSAEQMEAAWHSGALAVVVRIEDAARDAAAGGDIDHGEQLQMLADSIRLDYDLPPSEPAL